MYLLSAYVPMLIDHYYFLTPLMDFHHVFGVYIWDVVVWVKHSISLEGFKNH